MSDSDVSKRIREIIEKASAHAGDDFVSRIIGHMKPPTVVMTAKCRACGQKNRWTAGRVARCGKCGFPLPEAPVQ